MRVHDVSLTLRPDMPTWPGEQGPRVEPLKRMARGFIDGAPAIDRIPVDALVGECQVVGYDEDQHITQKWLERAAIGPGTHRVLFKTRNSARWAHPATPFDKDFIALDETAAHWLVRRGVKLVGIDYLSIEPFGSGKIGHPVHVALLRAGVVIVEGLDLHDVQPGMYELTCAPLKIADGTGSPARVFLIER
ncbi:MAG: cyclase family protein [Chloroflexi bacterium]|nr:cyclase family protein [Chloroflexota bacterium]